MSLSTTTENAPRVLVIEDDPTARAMLNAWLHTEGCRGEVQPDAAGGRAALAARVYDLLICDLHLPDADGTDIAAELSGANEGLPVVFLTGAPSLQTAMRSVQLRVAAYLVKPPDLDELRQILQREVTAHRCRRAIAASRQRLAAWDGELVQLEHDGSGSSRPVVGYLQVTVRQLAALLADLDRSMSHLDTAGAARDALREVDLVQGLRSAVAVLERTRSHFKSKDLGDLRRDLEALLGQIDPPKPHP